MLLHFTTSDLARFWAKVNKTTGCWLWLASTDFGGYGKFEMRYKLYGAHKISWAIAHDGTLPEHLYVLHDCPGGDNRLCVNPAHLWLGTQAENLADMTRKGRRAEGDRNGARLHPDRIPRGEQRAFAKLTTEQVRAIRARHADGATQRDLAREYGVHFVTVNQVVLRKTWTHVA